MTRKELEHLIRAACSITDQYELMIVGSQSILGAFPDAPEDLRRSMEADVYPIRAPDLTTLIQGTLGELSPFHETFGYYADGVSPETSILPRGWEERVVRIQNENTDNRIGYCLDVYDLACSKLAAGREKDKEFVNIMILSGIVEISKLIDHIELLPEKESYVKAHLQSWVRATDQAFSSMGFGIKSDKDDFGM